MRLPDSTSATSKIEVTRGVRFLAILGAGEEGSWLAARAARAGYQVTLEDLIPGKRRQAARRIAEEADCVAPIAFAGSVEEAARGADLVIDFVPDELESKLEILSLLDRMAPPHTIFATPTRVLSIADLASCTYRAEQCVGLRLPTRAELPRGNGIYPVAVVHAPAALPGTIEAVVRFWSALGAQVTTALDNAPLP